MESAVKSQERRDNIGAEVKYGDKCEVVRWVRELDQKQQRSAAEDREGDLTAGAQGKCNRERN